MPVTCTLINGKYRVVGPNGKIEMNKSGSPIDGGGHETKEMCGKQAAAINMNLSSHTQILSYDGNDYLAVSSVIDGVQTFKKDMIREGIYIHPVHKWKLNVTPERIQRWHTNFQEMHKNGVDVEIPLDHSLSAAKNLGYVIDTMIEKDSEGKLVLFGILEVRGEEAIQIIRRNRNVSVWIDQEFQDGKGNFYGEVIKHCSVVQQPVVQQQQDFIPIAASEGGVNENVPIYYTFTRSNKMDEKQLKKLKALFGLGEDATEENILSLVEAQTKKQAEDFKGVQDENLGLKSQLGKHKAASNIDPNTIELVGSTIQEKLSMLVEQGKITPVVEKKLSTVLVGPEGQRNVFSLSLGDNQSPSIAQQVVAALKENDIVKLGEKTKFQVLNREIPNDSENGEHKTDKESCDAMMSGAGVAVKD